MVKRACSRRGNHVIYIASVTPYIPSADGVKNSLVGACELFCNQEILTNYDYLALFPFLPSDFCSSCIHKLRA